MTIQGRIASCLWSVLLLITACAPTPPPTHSNSISTVSLPGNANGVGSVQPTTPGWSIPGLEGAETVSSEIVTLPTGSCTRRELRPPVGEASMRFGDDIPSRPEWRGWECTSRIWAYEIDGKPFAYVTYVTLGERNTTTGKDVAILKATYFEYRDDDGDGQFETRTGTTGHSPTVPAWAMNPSLKRQPN